MAVILISLTSIGGDPDCRHPLGDVCSGEERAVSCHHPGGEGPADGPFPPHEECPVGQSCSHPCGHLLSSLVAVATGAREGAAAEPFLSSRDLAPLSGVTSSPFHPPRPFAQG